MSIEKPIDPRSLIRSGIVDEGLQNTSRTLQELQAELSNETDLEVIAELHEEIAVARDEYSEVKKRTDKQLLYKNIRQLQTLASNPDHFGIVCLQSMFGGTHDFFKVQPQIMKFAEWRQIEGGQAKVMVGKAGKLGSGDMFGYAIVRPDEVPSDFLYDIYFQAWSSQLPNNIIIMPRCETHELPRQGPQKAQIMEQMIIINYDDYQLFTPWLQQMMEAND